MPTPPKKTALAKAVSKITAWSFSRWNDYNKCAKFAFFKHVLRLKEPGNEAMERGGRIDELATEFAKANPKKRVKCPPELKTFEKEFRDLQKRVTMSQEEWAFNREWRRTGWFDKDAWCRVKMDCAYVDEQRLVAGKKRRILVVIDYKTGKERDYHEDQMLLYALAGLLVEEGVDGVEVQLWYLDLGVQRPDEQRVFMRSELAGLKKVWEGKTKPMLSDTRFQEKAGRHCAYCHFRKANGGPCKF